MRFEHKLTLALVLTLTFSTSMARFANWTARRSHDLFERSRLAADVLHGYKRLSNAKHELFAILGRSTLQAHSHEQLISFTTAETPIGGTNNAGSSILLAVALSRAAVHRNPR